MRFLTAASIAFALLLTSVLHAEDAAEKNDLSVKFVSIEDGDFGKRLTFDLTNTSGKDIKAIKGGIYFFDQFGDKIGYSGLGVTIDEAIPAGKVHRKTGCGPRSTGALQSCWRTRQTT